MRIQFSCSVLSNSLWPHGLQHARPPCPSPTPGAYSNSCQWSRWCCPTISSSVVPFSSRLQSFFQGLFQRVSSLHQVAKVLVFSASPSVRPKNIQDWLPLGLTGLISLLSKWLSRVFSSGIVQKHQFFGTQLSFFFIVQLSYPYMTTGKTIALTWQTFVGKAIALLFNILSRSVIAFLPRSKKSLLISWLQSPSVVILKPPKIVSHFFHCFPIYLPWSNGIRRSLNGGVFCFFLAIPWSLRDLSFLARDWTPGTWQWKLRVLTTELLENSQSECFKIKVILNNSWLKE